MVAKTGSNIKMKKLGADWLSRGATGSLMNTKQLTFRFHKRWSIFYAEQGWTLANEVRFRHVLAESLQSFTTVLLLK
jgi:hypothetical protein